MDRAFSAGWPVRLTVIYIKQNLWRNGQISSSREVAPWSAGREVEELLRNRPPPVAQTNAGVHQKEKCDSSVTG